MWYASCVARGLRDAKTGKHGRTSKNKRLSRWHFRQPASESGAKGKEHDICDNSDLDIAEDMRTCGSDLDRQGCDIDGSPQNHA